MRAVSPISCISDISRVLLVACVSVASLLFSGPALAVDPLREAAARAQARVDATTTDLEQARREVKELQSKRQQAMEELAEQLEPEPIEWSEDALGDAQSDQRKRLCAAPDQTQACIDERGDGGMVQG